MISQVPQTEPKLDKPGAGLPLKARMLNQAYYKKISRDKLETKVFVPAIQGLEDSSRFWSVAMALVICGAFAHPLPN
jgi:hypothetical protein